MNHPEWIAILDYGSQVTQLIARRLREAQVYCEILRFDTTAEELMRRNPAVSSSLADPAVCPMQMRRVAMQLFLNNRFLF